MIEFDWILNGTVSLPQGLIFVQVMGHGWVVMPHGYWPDNCVDSWTCFEAAESFRQHQKEHRGY